MQDVIQIKSIFFFCTTCGTRKACNLYLRQTVRAYVHAENWQIAFPGTQQIWRLDMRSITGRKEIVESINSSILFYEMDDKPLERVPKATREKKNCFTRKGSWKSAILLHKNKTPCKTTARTKKYPSVRGAVCVKSTKVILNQFIPILLLCFDKIFRNSI